MPSHETSSALPSKFGNDFSVACRASGPLQITAKHRTTGVEHRYLVESPFVFIGRSAAVGVRLDDPSISQCHAYVQIIEGAVYCLDFGSRTGVIWNDGTQGRGWVKPGQTLRIGIYDVQIELSSSCGHSIDPTQISDLRASGLLSNATVEVYRSTNPVAVHHSLARPITLLGRHPSCELRFLDESISYFQSAFVNTSNGLWYVDLISRSGCLHNGRSSRLAHIRDADLVEYGKVSIVFRVGTHVPESQISLNEPATVPTVISLDTTAQGTIADVMTNVFMPVSQMVRQFQQCFANMTQMFSSMQQEHALLVAEQMRQIREMAEELRVLRAETRKDNPPSIPLTHPSITADASPRLAAEAKDMSPRLPGFSGTANSNENFPDAHRWFTERLANKG